MAGCEVAIVLLALIARASAIRVVVPTMGYNPFIGHGRRVTER